ncbi:exodeoxyribonuclease VII large subunit [Deferribacter thermophilus]|uniref:exodeoxyribonuclease VII large subunit n=1 Tax=Deferribacter thermophilus TaxID=53573 RepID=UPI003C238547
MNKYTVFELTTKIKTILESSFPGQICVVGEISNYSISTSGHCYFTLKDEKAQIKCVFFKRYRILNSEYEPKNGDKVLVTGDLYVYEKDGQYQILVKKIEYDSVGDFYKKFEEIKRKLEKEGLFDASVKKEIPHVIRKVAIITSPTGAAIKDFIRTIKKNGVNITIDIWPAPVQGEDAIPIVIEQINRLNSFVEYYDLLILMRGGGSLEDLAIFNDEFLARTFFNSKIPTISAIGHERDFTICDFVADLRVATPTAAAERVSEYYLTIEERIENLQKHLVKEMEYILMYNLQYLDTLDARLHKNSPLQKVRSQIQDINLIEKRMISFLKEILVTHERKIFESIRKLDIFNPVNKIENYSVQLEQYLKNIKSVMRNRIDLLRSRLDMMLNSLNLTNPDNILEKGYAIVFKEGDPITSVKNLHLEDELEIKLKDGYINGFVTGKKYRRH